MQSEFISISEAMLQRLQAGSPAPFAIWRKLPEFEEPLLRWPGNRVLTAENIADIKANKQKCLVLRKVYFA